MSDTCGNPSCSVSRHAHGGTLFCAEIEISGAPEAYQRKITYVWLCDGCARKMQPQSEVAGEVLRALLLQPCGAAAPLSRAVN
jgi:hypothetical protein